MARGSPPPETADRFYRNADGTPDALYEERVPPALRPKPVETQLKTKTRSREKEG
jgi:hypothetical protein